MSSDSPATELPFDLRAPLRASYACIAPALPGTYALTLRSVTIQNVAIGRLGVLAIHPGYYVYAGSALGPGGLAGRLRHHLSPISTPHWHIDYLRQVAQIEDVWYLAGTVRHEHEWARILQNAEDAAIPLKGFGSSDCACPAHLFYFVSPPAIDWIPGATEIDPTVPWGRHRSRTPLTPLTPLTPVTP